MRMRDHFSVDDLLTTLCDGEEKGAEENLRNYCRALYRAGMLGMTGRTKAIICGQSQIMGLWPRPTTGRRSASRTATRVKSSP